RLDRARPGDLRRVAGAELRAGFERGGGRLDDDRMPVTEDQCAVAAEEIDVAVAVHVPFVRALRAGDVDAVRVEIARVMGDAARQHLRRLARKLAGAA